MVVTLAVRHAVALEEVAGAQLLLAVRAGEVLRVPNPPQRRDHLTNDSVVTRSTVTLGDDGDALAAHVAVETAQHVVQVVAGRLLRGVAWRRLHGCLLRLLHAVRLGVRWLPLTLRRRLPIGRLWA